MKALDMSAIYLFFVLLRDGNTVNNPPVLQAIDSICMIETP